jgi:hypothetical protein
MTSRIALFPGGITGIGLLLLRLSVAVSSLLLAAGLGSFNYIPASIAALLAMGLSAGLKTRVLAILGLVAALSCLIVGAPPGLAAIHAISSAALAMTGPGAFSLDARLFGRRTISLTGRNDTIV